MSEPWLQLCKGRACIGCGIDDGTIVPAHSNQQAHGKGMGLKAASWTVIPLCQKCHAWLDNGSADRSLLRATWAQWWALHLMSLCQAELVGPLGNVPRATPRQTRASKSIPHPGVMSR